MTTIWRSRLIAALLGAVAFGARPSQDQLVALLGAPQRFVDLQGADTAVLLVAQVCLVAACLWLALAVWLAGRQLGGRPGRRTEVGYALLAPRRLRPVLAAVLGTGVVALSACATPTPAGTLPPAAQSAVESVTEQPVSGDSPASESPAPPSGTSTAGQDTERPDTSASDPQPIPPVFDWPAGDPQPPTPPSAATPTSPTTDSYVVADGDCLWHIVADRLPGASTADVANVVHELWIANESVIGADPDLLIPGQTLQLPAELTGSPS